MWPRPLYAKEVDVRSLRRGAEDGDWSRCLHATSKLLLRLPGQWALELARQEVAARLPVFERHAPGVTWPRELLQAIGEAGRQDEHPGPRNDSFSSPGAMSFITAVEHLWEASRIVGEHLKCALRLGDAVMDAIEAEVLEAWGVRHPEKWKRWCKVQGAQASEEYRDLKREMLSEPESMKRACRAWLELAGVLENAVARPSGSPKAELLALRQAAEDEDWSDCLEETHRLLMRLPAERALELTQKQVAARLPVFERHQPGMTWPREFIESVGQPSKRESLVWSDDYAFDGPGANNFINAVRELWSACHITGDDPKRVEALEGAIAGAIMAEEVESFGARHIEQWKHWYHEPPETRGEEYKRFNKARVNDPEARSVGRKAWLGLADELEKALRNSG